MERLTEELLTKFLIKYLKEMDFTIFSYDFPQSGTGYCMRPNTHDIKHKNINFWIPDIIATKEQKLLLFENKDHYSLSDINKLQYMLENNTHTEAIAKLKSKTNTLVHYILLGYPLQFFHKETSLSKHIDAELGCDLTEGTICIKENGEEISKIFER